MEHLFRLFHHAGHEFYLVGGAVRDLCRGIPLSDLYDLDFATNARPDTIAALLARAGLPVFTPGSQYGTVGTLLQRAGCRYDVQVTTYRADLYTAGSRNPEVTFGAHLLDDLSRRDFTINAMALAADGTFIDPWKGRADLAASLLRTVRDPGVTFHEDPLRMLRAARFIARLHLTPAGALASIMVKHAQSILAVSRERWLQEMQKLLVGPHADVAVRFLHDTALLPHLLPELEAVATFFPSQGRYHHQSVWEHSLDVLQRTPPRAPLRWGALLHDVGKPAARSVDARGNVHFLQHAEVGAALVEAIAARFRFDKTLHRHVKALVLSHQRPSLYRSTWTDATLRRFVRSSADVLDDLLTLCEADIRAHHPDTVATGLAHLAHLTARIASLGPAVRSAPLLPRGLAEAIMARYGLRPGPPLGHIKRHLEQEVLDGTLPQAAPLSVYLTYLDTQTPAVLSPSPVAPTEGSGSAAVPSFS